MPNHSGPSCAEKRVVSTDNGELAVVVEWDRREQEACWEARRFSTQYGPLALDAIPLFCFMICTLSFLILLPARELVQI